MVVFFGWTYGPGLPVSEKELRDSYAGKRVIVCGASYGIGADIAYNLAKANARLVISARSTDKLEKVAEHCRELGAAKVVVIPADFSTMSGSKALVEEAGKALGGVDVLILNHVIGMYEDWTARIMQGHRHGNLDESLAFVEQIFAVNTLSYAYISSYALPSLAKSAGRIIAVGSAAGRQGLPRVAPYSASKHAMFGYFDSLRQDLIASPDEFLRGITVTTGILGSFNTDSARNGTKGMLDHMNWRPPDEAALALLKAGARRWRDVYTPWEQTRIATLLHPLMPTTMDWVIRLVTLSGEAASFG